MQLEKDMLLGVSLIVVILLVISFGSVGLLWRMAPAIERILQENVVSLEAQQEMLSVIALAAAEDDPQQRVALQRRFEVAWQAARHNITEQAEVPILEQVGRLGRRAMAGSVADQEAAVNHLRELGLVNRQAMERADERARALGTAGAWAGVLLACLGLLTSWGVIRRLRRMVIEPFAELSETLDAAVKGDAYRRCTLLQAPPELTQAMVRLNAVLDQCGGRREPPTS